MFDVAVDIRKNSPSLGCWVDHELSAENKKQLWILEGFAHEFLVLSEGAELIYQVTPHCFAGAEITITWDDLELGIEWGIKKTYLVRQRLLGSEF